MEINYRRLRETLIRGNDSAKKLQNMLRRKAFTDGSVSAEDLVINILGSFSGGISMLNSCGSDDFSGIPASSDMGLGYSADQSPEIHTGKKPAPAVKEKRGCYKRRRTIDSREEIRASMEDNYAWRKYGQKEILNSKYPRCYFRCTHKNTHGCKALKQVQKLEDASNMFHITYFGHHSCPTTNTLPHPQIVLHFNDSKNHINFSNNPSTITSTHVEPSVKQETESKDQSIDAIIDNVSSVNDGHSSPSLMWDEGVTGDMASALMGFDHEDSCTSTSSRDYFSNYGFLNSDELLSLLSYPNLK